MLKQLGTNQEDIDTMMPLDGGDARQAPKLDTVARLLEDFLLTPALLIAIGKTLNVGFNLQQRATGICLPEFECDFTGLMQRCGRLQRIPRPLSPLATSKITVTMPFIRGTVEEMIFLERYNVWKDNRYGDEEDEDND